MSIARTRALGLGSGLGLVLLALVCAASLSRAQQPSEAKAPRKAQAPTRAELRERVIKLRGEVDRLQWHHNMARADLEGLLEKYHRLKLLQEMDVLTSRGMILAILEEFVGEQSLKALHGPLQSSLLDEGKASEQAAIKALGSLDKACGLRRVVFDHLSKELNARKLDLTDAERQYERSEAR